MEDGKFSRMQMQILSACFIVYFCAYIGRLNLSASLDSIMRDMKVLETAGGTLQTVFAIVYAAGQFVFGAIVDRLSPKKMIITGLLGSALSNVLFSIAQSFTLLCVLWALNGAFQAMLWTPIVRTIALNFTGKRRQRASFTMSFTLAGGHLAAWGLAVKIRQLVGWRQAFMIPCFVLMFAAAIAFFLLPNADRNKTSKDTEKAQKAGAPKASVRFLFTTGLLFVLVSAVTNGFLRDGVITWGPTILGMEEGMFTLIIPLINLFAILAGATIVRAFNTRVRSIAGFMMAFCLIPSILLYSFSASPVWALALMLGLMSAILYGSNTLYTALMPMEYDKSGRVGLVAGLIDSFIYVGSALAGTLTGFMRETMGSWKGVYAVWIFASILGAACMLISVRGAKKL
ncbi:MAG: MFS transporter [Clostridia bacterium]|nr:MFS transporter [Clostridia bacterium]